MEPFQLVIEFNPNTKRVELGNSTPGILNDRMLCYSMLEMAREVITTNGVRLAIAAAENKIVEAPSGLRLNGRGL